MTKTNNPLLWRLIVACQQTKSLAKACAQLQISMSSASKIIAAFEDETQLELLDRSTRPAALTQDLERLVPLANKILKIHSEAERAVQTIRAEKSKDQIRGRIVRICLPINVRNDSVLENLIDYAWQTPGLRLEFFGDDGLKRLLAGDVDIAQFGFHPKRQDIRADYIRTNGFLILASRIFARKYGLPQTVEELADFPIAIRNPVNRSFSRRLENADKTYFLPDGENLVYADTTTCRSLLVTGQAISVDVSIGTVLPELKAGELVPVLPGWHRHPNDTYVCCHTKQSLDPIICDLMSIIKSTLRDEKEDRWELWAARFGIPLETIKGAL